MMDNSNITLNEGDIEVRVNQWGDPTITIELVNTEEGKQIKQQILENQKLRDLIEKRLQLDKFEYESGAKLGNLEFKKLLDFETKLLQSILKESQA